MASLSCKIVTLGEGRVGKTSLCLKFVNNTFHKDEISTVNANYLKKTVQVQQGTIELNIWDTAGQERFRAFASNYYRDAKGALVVYDITDRQSFNKVISWINELKAQADKRIVIMVAGNKCDMEQERQINKADALEFCRKTGVKHFDTSAKNGNGVDEVFQELSEQIFAVNKDRGSSSARGSRRGRGVMVDRRNSEVSKKKGCC